MKAKKKKKAQTGDSNSINSTETVFPAHDAMTKLLVADVMAVTQHRHKEGFRERLADQGDTCHAESPGGFCGCNDSLKRCDDNFKINEDLGARAAARCPRIEMSVV